ncbi:MFS transporter [Neobacillus drentensis]|uniref:MFS transporter n=1 Tax=Neobacillus drentensis TaxID=220684 RepID=UPI001F2E5B0F|nr:MFS transporter [Neobacillus drentensis]ULT57646.1 MFS transporter [Neobacillus drentensis]
MIILRKEKQYQRLFLAGVVNGMGDRFSSVAVLALVLQITGSGLAVGMTLAIRLIPFAFFAPIGGWLADRFSRKAILVTTDLIRIVFALSFLWVHSKEELWIVYISSFLLAAGEAIYSPTRKSSIPRIVNMEHLLKVNGLEQVLIGIVLIGGAFSGGIVAFIFGPHVTFWLNAASFLGAAAIISTIKFPENERITENNESKKKSLFAVFKRIVLMSAAVLILFICEILIAFMNGIDNVLISVYAVNVYHLGDIGVGLFYGSLGIGLTLSYSIANRLRKNFLVTGLVCLMLEGTFLFLLSRTHLVVFAILLFCLVAFVSGIGNACFDTVLMKEIPEENQGMMFGLLATIGNTILGLSMFLAGVALNYLSPRSLGLIGGIAYILISIILLAAISLKAYRKSSLSHNDLI